MKGSFPFHKYRMLHFQRKAKTFHKIVINSVFKIFPSKSGFAPLKDHLFPTGKKKGMSICSQQNLINSLL